jgi:hypothetical protein
MTKREYDRIMDENLKKMVDKSEDKYTERLTDEADIVEA